MIEFIVGFGVGALAATVAGWDAVAQHVKDFKANREELVRLKTFIKTIQCNAVVCNSQRCVYSIQLPNGRFAKMYLPKV